MTWKHPHSPTTKEKNQNESYAKKQWQLCSGIVKATCGVNFSHQKQQSTATITAKLSKNCAKQLNRRDQKD
jgi:hypothetical protein